jgi:hypothetical protein
VTHSHNQTLLTRLGFNDPDRNHPDHALACEYLATVGAEQLVKTFVRLPPPERRPRPCVCRSLYYHHECKCPPGEIEAWSIAGPTKAEIEYHITKGDGQYKQSVGYMDVLIRHRWARCERWVGREDGVVLEGWEEDILLSEAVRFVAVEVKAQAESVGEIIKQINLYRAHFEHSHTTWVLATPDMPYGQEVQLLKQSKIEVAHLGEGFAQWKANRTVCAGTPAVSL